MENQDYSVPELSFPIFTNSQEQQIIKSERTGWPSEESINFGRNDDVMLFNFDQLSCQSIESSQEIDVVGNNDPLFNANTNSHSFNLSQGNQSLFQTKIELNNFCKLEDLKNESSHYVKHRLHDGKHIKIWECGTCGKEFGHQYTLMRHLPTHTDERKFQCNTCGKAFRQMSTLSQHKAIHSSERPYVCEICHKTFNRVSTLISHRKTHTGLKPHQCTMCNKAFHQKGNLRNHIFTHTNERPYKCDVCEKGFNQMSNLMCHKLKAHQRADKPKFICSVCNKDFPKRMALRNHEQYQHGICSSPERPTMVKENDDSFISLYVDPINTEAMRNAIESNKTPFALLRPLTGIPVLVRVMPAPDGRQMLVPASSEDLRKHGQITITQTDKKLENNEDETHHIVKSEKRDGSTVQIKIPVVATVIQSNDGGILSTSVVSPGPSKDSEPQASTSMFTVVSQPSDYDFSANNLQEVPNVEIECLTDSMDLVSSWYHKEPAEQAVVATQKKGYLGRT